ncbi:MAG TPA: hypothetical protein ENI08_03420 [Candidatus Dependentiae bacterium]|nr:hypothetical protein [Candidatus Dependentiae bacterium]
MNTFNDLVKDQWCYGGKKYASTATKESTDILVDDYGFNWLLGTLNKYIYRYKNLGREKDLLKIACYCFIMWLKFGFHVSSYGTVSDNYTTVESKAKFWDKFIADINESKIPVESLGYDKSTLLMAVVKELLDLRTRANITSTRLTIIYKTVKAIWILDEHDKKEVHDCDTWLEGNSHGKKT